MARKKTENKKTKTKKQGAVRKFAPNSHHRPWGRYFLGLILVAVTSYGVMQVPWRIGYEYIASLKNRPIQHVSVEGEFFYISKNDIQKILSEKLVNDFVDLKIKDLQVEIKNNPWVESASVRRVWPNSLVVKVKEQQPIALWGDEGFINRFGELIISNNLLKISHFPKLFGERESSNLIVKQYLELTKRLVVHELSITELSIDGTRSMRLKIDDSFDVLVGKNHFVDKIDSFLFVYSEQLKANKNEILTVDLRYSHGVAVSWRKNTTHMLTSQRD